LLCAIAFLQYIYILAMYVFDVWSEEVREQHATGSAETRFRCRTCFWNRDWKRMSVIHSELFSRWKSQSVSIVALESCNLFVCVTSLLRRKATRNLRKMHTGARKMHRHLVRILFSKKSEGAESNKNEQEPKGRMKTSYCS
jgi:hypothetical protein